VEVEGERKRKRERRLHVDPSQLSLVGGQLSEEARSGDEPMLVSLNNRFTQTTVSPVQSSPVQ
jgi:hypothetical protein